MEAIARQDTSDNRILLSNWVNNATNNPTEGSIAFDGKLKSFIQYDNTFTAFRTC